MIRSWIFWATVVGTAATAAAIAAIFVPNDYMRIALPAYLTGIGTLALAGTTVWLSQKDERSRRLERSHAAAFALARSMGAIAGSLGSVQFNQRLELKPWLLDVSTYGGDLADLEVMRRLHEVSDMLIEFDDWNQVGVTGWGVPPDSADKNEQIRRKQAVGRYLARLGETLSSHRAGKPLPPPIEGP